MSEIKVNKISPRSGTTLTLGDSGDDFVIPAGATLTNNGTASGFASIAWQSSIVTGSTLTAVAGNGYWIDTTSNACTITLPGSASVGDQIIFSDYKRTWGTNAITINTNSLNFQGNTSPNPEYNTSGQSVSIVYSGATQGWIPTVDDDVTLETGFYSVDFLVIAGGGGGGEGGNQGGGGGAGGYRNSYNSESSGGGGSAETSLTFTQNITYTITVGAGGAGATGTGEPGATGTDSSISGTGITTITSSGGGGGGGLSSGLAGGSGGGGGTEQDTGAKSGGSGTANQGYAGGSGQHVYPVWEGAGGGGGAGGAGVNGTQPDGGGDGGIGVASTITGSSVTRASGGGGGSGGTAPTGGGGNAGSGGTNGSPGTDNTGGGGGGANDNYDGGNGGSGVVILRMPTADYSSTTTGSPTVTTDGTDTILVFNASGSYTG
jgi:hypothetical protein